MSEKQVRAFEEALRALNVTFERSSADEAEELWTKWEKRFGTVEGKGAYHWELFTLEGVPSVKGKDSLAEYDRAFRALKAISPRLILLPLERRDLAYRCTSTAPLNFFGKECLVQPPSFDWTQAFTHEDGSLGPYFARAVAR